MTFSTFDLLHAGHIMMLAKAKRQCDYLICRLQMDPTIDRPEKNAPTHTVVERYIQLRGCTYVDEIVPYSTEQDLQDILRSFQLDVRSSGTNTVITTPRAAATAKNAGSICTSMRETTGSPAPA
ncbi:adenylyltransferase/cytidyltransferase family protein [Humibacter sp. RRB41]|uniref:adenylyltransferase/cytidyltransferase family protein n=1 Tax=Humibacter sp. RRB41 TaxID=2919946 RepID=UPI0035B19011